MNMPASTGTFLDKILDKRRVRVAAAKAARPLDEVRRAAAAVAPALRPDFSGPAPYVIAEVKKASPSKGLLRDPFDPPAIAAEYERAGAVAVSVLTEEDFFLGSLDDLRAVRAAVGIPVLRKDFVFDAYQLYEARAAGADMFLLIMAMLDDALAADLMQTGQSLGMTALVEVHDAEELGRALLLEPRLLGINNRNLRTFDTTLDTTLGLLGRIPPGVRVVSESGLAEPADLRRLMAAGVDSFLIGESFMRAPEPGAALATFIQATR